MFRETSIRSAAFCPSFCQSKNCSLIIEDLGTITAINTQNRKRTCIHSKQEACAIHMHHQSIQQLFLSSCGLHLFSDHLCHLIPFGGVRLEHVSGCEAENIIRIVANLGVSLQDLLHGVCRIDICINTLSFHGRTDHWSVDQWRNHLYDPYGSSAGLCAKTLSE